MAPDAITEPFARLDLTAQTKLLLLGAREIPRETLSLRARSLHIEHVSSADLLRREISRPRGPTASESAILAALRRWFFARKPDAGFVLCDFPATLLQAKVFDEWLDARGETLDGVWAGPGTPGPLRAHYRHLGLLAEDESEAPQSGEPADPLSQ